MLRICCTKCYYHGVAPYPYDDDTGVVADTTWPGRRGRRWQKVATIPEGVCKINVKGGRNRLML